ncbi:MAG TPA: asparaginase domain-containing protein, partial [Opitutus sp.]|nr:asparaginase domain-containing protein [Opitutus sp.]
VFAGPGATILNTPALVTSQKAREKYGLPALTDWRGRAVKSDVLRMQRLAKPATVYIEAYSAHPLEKDSSQLYAPPDGYLDSAGNFHPEKQSPGDVPVFEVVLKPEDGLYPLPYMARRADGSAWGHEVGEGPEFRQTFFPDASRLFDEIERWHGSQNANLRSRADFSFFRAVPSGGYRKGLPASARTDAEAGDISPEKSGVDFFPYDNVNHNPPRSSLVRITNLVQSVLADTSYRGAIWLEGSPRAEDTIYWLNLTIGAEAMIVATVAQRPNLIAGSDGAANILDAVDFILSRTWREADGRNRVGAVMIQDQQIFAAREVVKSAARPGGFKATGGHGGIIGSTIGPVLTFVPERRHGKASNVRYALWPAQLAGVRSDGNRIVSAEVKVKDEAGRWMTSAVPYVETLVFPGWMTAEKVGEGAENMVNTTVQRLLAESQLVGLVAEGQTGGYFDGQETAALERAVLRGIPVVSTSRGMSNHHAFVNPTNLIVEGANLPAEKARVLLMACLLRFGNFPPCADPLAPTQAELAALKQRVAQFQEIFSTH